MSTLSNPWSGNTDTADPLVGADLGTWLDAIRTAVNSIDNTNISASAGINITKLDKGVISHYLGASVNQKVIYGTKSVGALVAGVSSATAVDFDTDADTYGSGAASNFTAAPIVICVPITVSATTLHPMAVTLTSVSTTGFTATVTCSASDTTTVTINWIAIGAG